MITNTVMCWGDQMCAQMMHLADLYYICRENGQELVLFRELEHFRAGFRFSDAFDISFVHYLERAGAAKRFILRSWGKMTRRSSWQKRMKRSGNKGIPLLCDRILLKWVRMGYRDFRLIGGEKDDVHTDPALLALGREGNYDIFRGFGTYQDWKKYEKEIIGSIAFKPEVTAAGEAVFSKLDPGKKKIAVHLRRTDYLVVFPFHLDDDYYLQAMSHFDAENVQYVVFSDDIDYCKGMEIFRGKDVFFMEGNSGPVDLYLMTRCDGNIIANSTFSFWGAMLNRHEDKKVVCPKTFVGSQSAEFSYIDGNYYPETWIAL